MLAFAVRSFSSGNYLAVHVYNATPFGVINKLTWC
uniref:Uncharacterized protein n=1 Tax=Arundo donax TaxID=35708 RepID=A0A0A9B2E8_ARUDO